MSANLFVMAIIAPIYSIEKESEVYHNNTECTERNNIETKNVRAGEGGKRLCYHCAVLNRSENLRSLGALGAIGIASGLFGSPYVKK